MDAYGIIDVEKIDLSKITIGPLRGLPNANGAESSSMKTARILYDGVPLKVRLAKMPTSWGLSAPMGNERANQPYRLELSLGRDPQDTAIYKLSNYLDNAIRKSAEENPKDFLNKRSFSNDLFEERFKGPCLRWSRDRTTGELKDYPPSLRMNVPLTADGEGFQVDGFFNAERKPIQVNVGNASQMISRNDQCRCIVLFDKIWANQLGFGCKIRLIQIRVYKTALRLGEVDMTGGDDEVMPALSDHGDDDEDNVLAQANMHLAEMRRGGGSDSVMVEATA